MNMSVANMSEEEKAAIRKQHEEATKKLKQHVADIKSGAAFKKPEKPAEEKKEEKNG
jgi:hypothetical protein